MKRGEVSGGDTHRAERVLSREPAVRAEPPVGDVIERDEHGHASVAARDRFSPALWLWVHARMNAVAVSRMARLVLGFVIADRGDDALRRLLHEELHPDWRDLPIKTDGRRSATYL